MTSESAPRRPPQGVAADNEDALRVLELSARLLLQYNLRSAPLERQLARVANHLGVTAQAFAGYRDVTLVTRDGRDLRARVPELRLDVAVYLATREIIDDLCADRIALDEARRRLETVETSAPRHNRWLLAALFGLGACALAWLLAADWGAVAASGVSSALGLVARQELGRHRPMVVTPPFIAALIGAVLGGLSVSLGWTHTPGLSLIVPALMLVPGPHLINGVTDLVENHMQTGLCRLALAGGVLLAAALGVALGGWLVLGTPPPAVASATPALQVALPLDVALAGLAACAFGAFYNTPWRVLWVSILCGMLGHGVRALCLDQGMTLEIATLLGCAVIGLVANVAADRLRALFSTVAFAGAVPMMPGLYIYESLAGAMRLSAAGAAPDATLAGTTLALFLKGVFVVLAMVVGLLAGARAADVVRARQRTA